MNRRKFLKSLVGATAGLAFTGALSRLSVAEGASLAEDMGTRPATWDIGAYERIVTIDPDGGGDYTSFAAFELNERIGGNRTLTVKWSQRNENH